MPNSIINHITLPNGNTYDFGVNGNNITGSISIDKLIAGTENTTIPSSLLPSYVDDVLEFTSQAEFPSTGASGIIYLDASTNKSYRWGGSSYVAIVGDIALGTTSSTAFPGDKGQEAYTHAVTNKGSAFDSGLYKITTNAEGHVTAATPVTKNDLISLGISASDTTYVFDGTYNDETNPAATVATVENALGDLDGVLTGTPGANKTFSAFVQEDGKVTGTFTEIAITKSQITDLGTIGAAAAKGVDNTVTAESTNLPTSAAVIAYVADQGFSTSDTTYSFTYDALSQTLTITENA